MKTMNVQMRYRLGTAAVLAVLVPYKPILAHPGHGSGGVEPYALVHYLLEPMHVVPALLVAFAVTGSVMYWRSRRNRSEQVDDTRR